MTYLPVLVNPEVYARKATPDDYKVASGSYILTTVRPGPSACRDCRQPALFCGCGYVPAGCRVVICETVEALISLHLHKLPVCYCHDECGCGPGTTDGALDPPSNHPVRAHGQCAACDHQQPERFATVTVNFAVRHGALELHRKYARHAYGDPMLAPAMKVWSAMRLAGLSYTPAKIQAEDFLKRLDA